MNRWVRTAVIAAAILALDRITKLYIQAALTAYDTHPVIAGFFNIVHVENPGAAFGMLDGLHGAWRTVLLTGVSIAAMSGILFVLHRPSSFGLKDSVLLQIALATVLGGALGNLWDRAFRGTVTDFLQFFFGTYEFPSFNVADIMINVGAGLLLLTQWRNGKQTV